MARKDVVNALQVQSTNDASIISKCSMAKKNYFKDDFVQCFVEKEKPRASLIHLGYYARAVILSETLLKFIHFLREQKILKFQIISCGSGFDTTYWRLAEKGLLNDTSLFVEIDYPNVVSRKVSLIKQSPKLMTFVSGYSEKTNSVKQLNQNHFLLCVDLCNLSLMEDLFHDIGIDFNAPTLFVSECVITYMKENDSNTLIEWMTRKFKNCGFVNYEQIHPDDGFGDVMLKHFDKLQSSLNSVLSYPDCGSHVRRYQLLGFKKCYAYSEWDLLTLLTSLSERKRVLQLEQFDEFEEFHLKCTHYVIGIAVNNVLIPWLDQFRVMEEFEAPCLSYGCQKYFTLEETHTRLELFGHVCCRVDKNSVLIFGGFGPMGRSKNVYKLTNGELTEIQVVGLDKYRLDAIHGCAASFELKGRTFVALYGGRTSPSNVCNGGDCLLLEYFGDELRCRCAVSDEDGPKPRYRSTMVCHSLGLDTVAAWVFGGRTHDLKDSLSDLWQLMININDGGHITGKWTKKDRPECCSLWPRPRMSHSAVLSHDKDAMYVVGGLDAEDFSVLNDIWKWSFASESWEAVQANPLPRYCLTLHTYGDFLYLVGGVNTSAGRQPGLGVLKLSTLEVREFPVESFRSSPVLLFNHSTFLDPSHGATRIVVLGGGGNCFSFGTYFNKNFLTVPLQDLDDSVSERIC